MSKTVLEVTPELHREVRIKALERGITTKQLTKAIVKDGLNRLDAGKLEVALIKPKTEEVEQ